MATGSGRRSSTSLGEVMRVMAGRALVRSTSDPVLPWVSRAAEAVFHAMRAGTSGDPEMVDLAAQEFDLLVEDARAQADEWRAQGREDFVRRLSIAMRVPL